MIRALLIRKTSRASVLHIRDVKSKLTSDGVRPSKESVSPSSVEPQTQQLYHSDSLKRSPRRVPYLTGASVQMNQDHSQHLMNLLNRITETLNQTRISTVMKKSKMKNLK